MEGKIFSIKRFAVHDGDGIRTTVFFKGCPLKCLWCHNPEGISFGAELQYISKKCISCKACADACDNDVHLFEDNIHILKRERCIRCGKCVDACITKALNNCFDKISVEALIDILLEDAEFYRQTNGGVTLSGGECLCQADFCAEVLKRLKMHHIHCAIDTCGYADKSEIDKVAPYTDVFLYDIKHISEKEHIKLTGKSNKLILENLKYIDTLDKQIEVRIPVIPTLNDDAIDGIGEFLKNLKNLKVVRLLPYNSLAGSKYKSIGMENTLPKVEMPDAAYMKAMADRLQKYRIKVKL